MRFENPVVHRLQHLESSMMTLLPLQQKPRTETNCAPHSGCLAVSLPLPPCSCALHAARQNILNRRLLSRLLLSPCCSVGGSRGGGPSRRGPSRCGEVLRSGTVRGSGRLAVGVQGPVLQRAQRQECRRRPEGELTIESWEPQKAE